MTLEEMQKALDQCLSRVTALEAQSSTLLEVANEQEKEIAGLTKQIEDYKADAGEYEKALGLFARAFEKLGDRSGKPLIPAGEYFGTVVG